MEYVNRHRSEILWAVAAIILLAAVALLVGHSPDLIRGAFSPKNAPKDDTSISVGQVTQAVDKIDGDVLPFMAAVVPMAVVIGAVSMMVGSRRGTSIIGSAIGALILVAAIKGIAA